VNLLIRILDPKDGDSVYDPACGSGGMLVETINTVKAHHGDTRTLRLYGQEVNLTTSAIARMNLFLHDIEDFKIVRGDTLRSPGLRDPDGKISTFSVTVANPPFSLQNWGADTWAADPRSFCGIPPAKNGDMAWIQHMVASMDAQEGRVGVVMPHGVLFRGGAEAKIRDDASAELERLKAEIIEANKRATTNLNVCEARIRDERLKATENRAGHLDALAESVDEIRHRQSLTDREIQSLQDTSDENNNALAVLVSKYRRLQIHLERVTAAIKAGVSTCRSNVVLSIISSLVVTFLK